MAELAYVLLHTTPLWGFAMAVAAALGWHLGTALWRWGARLGRRR